MAQPPPRFTKDDIQYMRDVEKGFWQTEITKPRLMNQDNPLRREDERTLQGQPGSFGLFDQQRQSKMKNYALDMEGLLEATSVTPQEKHKLFKNPVVDERKRDMGLATSDRQGKQAYENTLRLNQQLRSNIGRLQAGEIPDDVITMEHHGKAWYRGSRDQSWPSQI